MPIEIMMEYISNMIQNANRDAIEFIYLFLLNS